MKALNICGMKNWTHDVPPNSKEIMLKVLDMFRDYKNPKILEIGTFCGVSIIEMLLRLENAQATCIDAWIKKDVEYDITNVKETFYQNIYPLRHRIIVIENDSTHALLDLIEQKNKYDFIYVDGSHNAFDCYCDIILAWKLLEKNGVLGIDDCLWGTSDLCIGNNVPYNGVNHFFHKFFNEFEVINNGYRLFLRKL